MQATAERTDLRLIQGGRCHLPGLVQVPAWHRKAATQSRGVPRYICPHTGIRFYDVPDGRGGQLALPGATSVLSHDAPAEERERLALWRQKEIDEGRDPDAAAKRGTAVHAVLEDVVRGIPLPDLQTCEDSEVLRYASGMDVHLAGYDSFLWNERPLVRGWEHCWSEAGPDGHRLARVWSTLWGFAGTPDLLGRHRCGLNILGDFKTSTRPYFRCSGRSVPEYKRIGYLKYKKTVRQLCAYRLAMMEMFDIQIDALQIIVGLPENGKAQMFFIRKHEIELETLAFKKSAMRFWDRQNRLRSCAAPLPRLRIHQNPVLMAA